MTPEERSLPDIQKTKDERNFPFFMVKKAPVTGKTGMMEYDCGFSAECNGDFGVEMLVRVPVTTLCPCSKEISARGAHNQRGWVSVRRPVCARARRRRRQASKLPTRPA